MKLIVVSEQEKKNQQPLPVIDLIPGELHIVVRKAEDALISTETPIYQRGGQVVRPARIPIDTEVSGVMLAAGMLLIEPVSKAWLAEKLNQIATWRKYSERQKEMVGVDCPPKYAEHYLAKKGEWNIGVLTGIVEAPTLRLDGSLLDRQGYDPASGLYLNYTGQPIAVLNQPDKEDALAALDVLKEPFEEFPFVDEISLSVALSAVLTAVVRRSFKAAPYHAVGAPTPGSGKGLLVDAVALIATGRAVVSINQGVDPAEDEKRIGALLMKGVSILSVDNVERYFEGEFLCSLATQEFVEHRVLGTSTTVTLPANTSTIFITGNNLVLKGDMTRRVLLCRIDPQCERPDAREFKRNLPQFIIDNRHRLLSAALTILRAYVCAGSPPHGKAPYGSFEAWDSRVRGALLWLGLKDPLESRESILGNDPEVNALRALLDAWYGVLDSDEVTVGELIIEATPAVFGGAYRHPNGADLHAALLEVASHDGVTIHNRRLGDYLRKSKDRVVNGYRLERCGVSHKVALWRVRAI